MDSQLGILAHSVSKADNVEDLTRSLLQLIQRISGLQSVYLTLVDQAAQIQRVLYSENTTSLIIEEGLSVPWKDTLCRRALQEGRYATDDVPGCWGDSEAAKQLKLQSYVAVPVLNEDESLYGTLCGASRDKVEIDQEVIELLHLCAELISHQLERKNRIHRAENRASYAEARLSQLQMLTEISRVCLAAKRLPDAILQVTEILAQDRAWSEITPILIAGTELELLKQSGDYEEALRLVRQMLDTDEKQIQLIIKNQLEPLIWGDADTEAQKMIVVVTSDEGVEAALVVQINLQNPGRTDSMELLNSVANSLSLLAARLSDHEHLEAANQVLEHRALHDVLTGLPNRRYLIEALDDKLTRTDTLGTVIYVAFIDLDGFKKLNDEYGHDIGDEFLRAFAARVSGVMRGHDLVARYGGDEFVFVGEGSPDEDLSLTAHHIVERIRSVCSGLYTLSGVELDYGGPSIGIIHWQAGDVVDADVVLAQADAAMYKDKQARRQVSV